MTPIYSYYLRRMPEHITTNLNYECYHLKYLIHILTAFCNYTWYKLVVIEK
jgi:hypothetical protein